MNDRRWRIAPGIEFGLAPADPPRVMAIINVTPDSFSDGGVAFTIESAVARGRLARDQGAAILDIGGESTRPGAARVSAEEQIARVIPVILGLGAAGVNLPISIDTTRASVARAALDAGASIINDVSAGTEDADIFALAAERRAGLILMHRLRPPERDVYSTQYASAPEYDPASGGVVGVVRAFLAQRLEAAERSGVDRAAIVIDPGLGFGKSVEQNHELIRRIGDFTALGRPILSAASRKSFLSSSPGLDHPKDRDAASVAVSVAHALAGVRLFRVHDVEGHVAALGAVAALPGIL